MKRIKRSLPVLVAVLFVAVAAFPADEPKGSIDFANMSLDKVLLFYKDLSKCQLIESSDVKKHYQDISVRASGLSKADTLKLIEKSLAEQAGVVITRLDDTRVSVTFNDALPITPVKRRNPLKI